MSLAQSTPQPPPLDQATKPKRSVSFLNHSVVSSDDSKSSSTQRGPSSFQPSRRKGYVRKGPIESDSGSEEDEDENLGNNINDSESSDDDDNMSSNSIAKSIGLPPKTVVARPGQNYVRRAPANSDTESDQEDALVKKPASRTGHATTTTAATIIKDESGDSDSESERDGKDIGSLAQSFAHSRISRPGQNYVRRAPVNSDTESDDDLISGGVMNGSVSRPGVSQGLGIANSNTGAATGSGPLNVPIPVTSSAAELASLGGPQPPHSARTSPPSSISASPAHHPALNTPPRTGYAPSLGMTLGNVSNSSMNGAAASSTMATSMALYQQQHQEMMMIMQQQQIQIATMQQQQQAFQLLAIQQQQQHQQHLQAVQLQHSRANSSNGSIHNDDNDDDDVPLGDRKLQLPSLSHPSPLMGPQPGTPSFATLPTVHLSPDMQSSILSMPLPIPLQYSPLQHSRQASASSVHSFNSTTSNSMMPQYHLQPMASSPLNPASSSPLLQPHSLHHPYQNQYHSNSQPRLADFIEEEQERMMLEQGGAKLLSSSFPAGYRNSLGSNSLGQLNLDRGSLTSLHSTGSANSSGNGNNGAGVRPNSSRNSLIPQQTLLQSISSPPSSLAMPFHSAGYMQQQTLIQVEAKPPPPQTGLVGAISAMEREKKLAKAQGTNQLQFQHQQQQQQFVMNAEKELWLQDQRRLAWEAEQQQLQQWQQQQHLQQQGQQLQQQQQQQQGQLFSLPAIPNIPLWTVDDDQDDNRPLGGA